MKHLLLSCTCLLLCAIVTPVSSDIRREAEALLKWKASLTGAEESLSSWSFANSPSLCHWMHIGCNSVGNTTIMLNISGASLNGTLDKLDFSAFPNLKTLILSGNGLHGDIPGGIGNLTSLVKLQIDSNQYLTGAIPRGIGQLKQLTELQLEDLGLDGALPEEIGNLTSLKKLSLYSINLAGSIPLTIGKLKKLHLLNLRKNNLTGHIPLEIGNMTELGRMDLTQNYLHGKIPGTISDLVKLSALLLSENQLGGDIIPELGNSSTLSYINIADNRFSGLFPSSICAGGALVTVIAAYNGFTSLDDLTFQNCTTLKHIDFTENNIVADLMGWFAKPPEQLRGMAFSKNQLSGTLLTDRGGIPREVGNLALLESLDLSVNQLSGEIPPSLADLTAIGTLNLSSNRLSGRIPTGSQLQTFDPSAYSNNSGLCGSPLQDCVNPSAPKQNEMIQDEEALWLYCFVVAGVIFGFWLYWGMLLYCNETWRCALYQYVDSVQDKVITKCGYSVSAPTRNLFFPSPVAAVLEKLRIFVKQLLEKGITLVQNKGTYQVAAYRTFKLRR
uniref:Uncharacterized protein n=1 Tax=Avena sativa TaxID=4498 RepID=A0ACD5V1J8_AVESA